MGTNYYARINICKECKRPEQEIHLGKNSFGWTFSFQYNEGQYYKNVKEMAEWLKDKRIFDEYGDECSADAFWKMVSAKQEDNGNRRHAKEHASPHDFFIDGYSFSDIEFS